jgi:hypothetical protein
MVNLQLFSICSYTVGIGQNVNFALYLVCLTAREARNMNPFLATTPRLPVVA